MHVDRPLVAVPIRAPHAVEELLARKGETDVVGQERQQIELAGRQRHGGAGMTRLPPSQVHLEFTQRNHFLRRRTLPRPPQYGPHPRHQFPRRERLDQIIISPELQPENAVDLVVAGGEKKDRHVAAGADFTAHRETVAGAGKADVEDDDAGVSLCEHFQPLLSVAGQEDPEAVATEVEVHQVGNVWIVLDDDHRPVLSAHMPSLPSPAPRMAGIQDLLTEP